MVFSREVDFKVNGHIHVIYFLLNTPPSQPFDVTTFADAYVTDVDLLCDPMPNNIYTQQKKKRTTTIFPIKFSF